MKSSLKVFTFSSFPCDIPSAHLESKGDDIKFDQGKTNLHRRDTDTSQKSSTPNPFEQYLSRESRTAKERSEIWAQNADGVLTFVSHKSCCEVVLFSTRGLIRLVFSPCSWSHSYSSAIRCYCPIQLIPPICCFPKSYRQMGQFHRSRFLLLTDLPFNPKFMLCV